MFEDEKHENVGFSLYSIPSMTTDPVPLSNDFTRMADAIKNSATLQNDDDDGVVDEDDGDEDEAGVCATQLDTHVIQARILGDNDRTGLQSYEDTNMVQTGSSVQRSSSYMGTMNVNLLSAQSNFEYFSAPAGDEVTLNTCKRFHPCH